MINNSDDFIIIIPARYESVRLPGKLLLPVVKDKTLLQLTYERALSCKPQRAIIATDSAIIAEHAISFGAQVVMTSSSHTCGTLRIAEVVAKLSLNLDTVVVNLQGDEPLTSVKMLNLVGNKLLVNKDIAAATLAVPITAAQELYDPNVVKVVLDANNTALLFTRAPAPYARDGYSDKFACCYRHIGVYAYTVDALLKYSQQEASPLEQIEKLEQLRILWHGGKVAVEILDDKSVLDLPAGVDTAADLTKLRSYLSKQQT